MVYHGPSKGCATCRRRRVRCDEGRPVCQNCRRLSLACSGYPNEATIRFHDETKAVVAEGHRRRQRQILIGRSQEDVDQIVIKFWMQNYAVAGRSLETSLSHIEYLPHLFEGCSPGSVLHLTTLVLATSSVCMWAGMGPDAGPVQRHLGRAICRLQRALDDPIETLQDETLMATLLLQCRDNLTAFANMHKVAASHYNGAVALIKHRGRLNFRTEISKQMLISIRSFLISSALKNSEPIRNDSDIWIDWSAMPNNPATRLDRIGAQIARLQVDFSGNVANVASLAARAEALNEQLLAWTDDLPEIFQPKYLNVKSVPESVIQAGVYGDRCELFENVQVSDLWNTYRCHRLIVLGILIRCSLVKDTEPASFIQAAQQLVDDICASVPFHLGSRTTPLCLANFVDPSSVEFPNLHDFGAKNKAFRVRHTLAQGGWHLLGPLAHLNQILDDNLKISSSLSTKQREWIKTQLERVTRLHIARPKAALADFAQTPTGPIHSLRGDEPDHFSLECVEQLRTALSNSSHG